MNNQKILTGGGRIQELDLMRGIAIILMITGHSILVYPIDFTSITWCQNLHNWIYSFHMEMFFLVSGAVFHCTKYQTYIANKADRLLVPMVFVGLFSMMFHSFGGDLVNKHATVFDSLKGMVTGKTYWFLYTLFIIAAIYPFWDIIGKKNKWYIPFLLVLIVVLNSVILYPRIFRINSVMYYLPYFMMGHLLSSGLKSGKYKLQTVNLLLFCIGCVIIYLLLWLMLGGGLLVRYIKASVMIVAFYYLLQMFLAWYKKGSRLSIAINDLLCTASRYSLQLYLFNGFVLVVARTLLVSKMHLTNPAIVIPLIVIANLVVTLPFCIYCLEKTKWVGWLCGVKYRPWKKQ